MKRQGEREQRRRGGEEERVSEDRGSRDNRRSTYKKKEGVMQGDEKRGREREGGKCEKAEQMEKKRPGRVQSYPFYGVSPFWSFSSFWTPVGTCRFPNRGPTLAGQLFDPGKGPPFGAAGLCGFSNPVTSVSFHTKMHKKGTLQWTRRGSCMENTRQTGSPQNNFRARGDSGYCFWWLILITW